MATQTDRSDIVDGFRAARARLRLGRYETYLAEHIAGRVERLFGEHDAGEWWAGGRVQERSEGGRTEFVPRPRARARRAERFLRQPAVSKIFHGND